MDIFPLIRLPRRLQLSLESSADALLRPTHGPSVDFTQPSGEAALASADSLSWRIFKNPIALMVGGIAAVILELAEPAVRTGVWQFSAFRRDPAGRLQRTGMAAMVTVYGARSVAVPMIERVVRMHSRVTGVTPSGEAFCANDRSLLRWVQATASFGFAEAYTRYVAPLAARDVDRLYTEGRTAALLYGAESVPVSSKAMDDLFDAMRGRLERSDIIFEFLNIMRTTSALPSALSWMQPVLVRAAVDLLPDWIRGRLGLTATYGLSTLERTMVRTAGALSDRLMLTTAPPSQACLRLGLPVSYLYQGG